MSEQTTGPVENDEAETMTNASAEDDQAAAPAPKTARRSRAKAAKAEVETEAQPDLFASADETESVAVEQAEDTAAEAAEPAEAGNDSESENAAAAESVDSAEPESAVESDETDDSSEESVTDSTEAEPETGAESADSVEADDSAATDSAALADDSAAESDAAESVTPTGAEADPTEADPAAEVESDAAEGETADSAEESAAESADSAEAESADSSEESVTDSAEAGPVAETPASAVTVVVSGEDAPAPRRRRGGRRVVRGAGAAGASLELKVEEKPARRRKAAEPASAESAETAEAADETEAQQPTRSRAKSAAQDAAATAESAPARRTRRRAAAAEDDDLAEARPSRSRRRAAAEAEESEDDMRPSRSRRRASAEAEESEEEPRPARSRRRAAVAENDDIAEERPARRTRRRAAAEDEDAVEPRPSRFRRAPREDEYEDEDYAPRARSRRRARDHYDEDYDERAFDALDNLPDELGPADRQRPMTSLLFQEPVIPARGRRTRDDYDEDEYDSYDERDHRDDRRDDDDHDDRDDRDERDDRARRDGEPARSSRRTRSRRRGGAQHDAEAAETAQGQDERNGRNGQKNGQGTQDNQGAKGDDQSEESGHSRRGNRRLNAQERRAAAEVEQIEEDLELDDITYAPITEEDLSEGPVRSRRRRRRGGNGQNGAAQGEHAENETHEVEDEQGASSRRHRNGEAEDGEQTVTRRRRRRRGKGEQAADSGDDQILARRSRKQQYIDEITDIEGSTRLEAKKQRRRDNRRERSRQSQLMEQDFLARRENVERLMVVREKEHHTQISVVEDNVLVEHYVSDIQEVQTVGNIYLGRVQNVLPSMEAAFVDIGQARNGVLYAGEVNWDAARLEGQPRRIELAFKSGDPVLVQVTKDPIGHKGARLTSQVTLAGRFLVLVPSGGMTGVSRKLSERERSRLKGIVNKIAPKDMGVIIRTAAGGASEEAIVKDLESLVKQWEHITAKRDEFLHGKRPKLLQGEPDVAIRVVRDIFNDDFTKLIVEGDKVYQRIEEYLDTRAPDLRDKLERWDPADHGGKDVFDKWQIDSQLRKGMERQVYLPSGGSIVIDRTEAMTTIDVNTGRFIGRGKSLEETVTRCNLEASEEIARQLRLRDIGGMVMIDYVDMVMPANRDLVLRRLVECLARDRTKHQVAEVTSLGLVQMTRKRIGQGLVEAFSEECPTCKGRGFILHDKPTVSADYDDPYAMRGGDPFVKTNKHGRGTQPAPEPAGSSPDVKAKLAQIAAAAVAANNAEHEQH